MSGGYGLFILGYLSRPSTNLRAYPLAGIGGGGLTLEIGSTGAEDFDDVLGNPNRSATLDQASVLISLGAGMEYQFHEAGGQGEIRVGLRAGYLLSPYTPEWTLDERSLSAGPDATLGGPFFRLTIGGGGGDVKDDEDNE